MQKQIIARFPNCGYGFIVEEYKSAAVGLSATIVTYGIAIVAAVLRKLFITVAVSVRLYSFGGKPFFCLPVVLVSFFMLSVLSEISSLPEAL